MAYTKKTWIDNESYVDADSMNNIENGIYNNDAHIGDLNDLETDDKTNLVEAINEVTTKGGGVTLYENASGTTGNIPLSQNVSGFSFLEIYYSGSTLTDTRVKKITANSLRVTLDLVASTASTLYLRNTMYTIYGNKLTLAESFNYNILASNGSINMQSSTNAIYTTKVVGIR